MPDLSEVGVPRTQGRSHKPPAGLSARAFRLSTGTDPRYYHSLLAKIQQILSPVCRVEPRDKHLAEDYNCEELRDQIYHSTQITQIHKRGVPQAQRERAILVAAFLKSTLAPADENRLW